MADALHFVAMHLTTNDAASSAEPSTPQCCTTAIRAVTTDTNLTCAEQIKLMGLFVKDIAAADSYLAIDDVELHTEFIHEQLTTFI